MAFVEHCGAGSSSATVHPENKRDIVNVVNTINTVFMKYYIKDNNFLTCYYLPDRFVYVILGL